MIRPQRDDRTTEQRDSDELIAAEPPLPRPATEPNAVPVPLESLLRGRTGQPFAVAGVVENGLVKPLDPDVRLPEHARVIIVAEKW
jgi:hypothetical protein